MFHELLDMDKNGNLVPVRAYPVGQERKDINASFDRLIDALKKDGFLHERGETVKPDDVQYQQREYLDDGDIRDDIYYPKNAGDAHAFLRSFANKTSGMQNGETKNVLVHTKDHAYFVIANGYLKGDIERVIPILGNEDVIDEARKEFSNDTYTGAEAFDTWTQTVRSNRGRDSWDLPASGYAQEKGRYDDVDVEASGSDTVGSDWESPGDRQDFYGYQTYDELIEALQSGAVVMDENGNPLTYQQFQQRTDTLTDREVLAEASGDDVLRRECQSNINKLTGKYNAVADAAGLRKQMGKTYVEGFKAVDEEIVERVGRSVGAKAKN